MAKATGMPAPKPTPSGTARLGRWRAFEVELSAAAEVDGAEVVVLDAVEEMLLDDGVAVVLVVAFSRIRKLILFAVQFSHVAS